MKKNPQVIEQRVDNELLIIPMVDGVAQMKQVCCLSESGAVIWELMAEKEDITEDEIIEGVALHYQISSTDIREDILGFINMMAAQNIVIREEIK